MTTISRRSGVVLIAGLLLTTLAAYALYARPQGLSRALAQPPATRRVSQDSIHLAVRSDRAALLRGSDGDVHVEVTLSADQAAGAASERQPSDVLVVLDISGSMAGQKLDYAKQALHQLIDRLDGNDRFGLVAYASEAQLLFPLARASASARAQVHAIVGELGTLGGTNMSAGLDLGIAELRRQAVRSRSARVLLLSDGQANEGDSSLVGLQQRARGVVQAEHVLSTLGIGDDFNEDLMTSLADVGTGNFYYLSKVEVLGDFFDAELRANQQTVARALELRFDPGPGVQLVEASGYPIEQYGQSARVRPGNLYGGQKRTLWMSLRAPTGNAGQVPLGRFSLVYKRGDVARQLDAEPLPALAVVDDQRRFEHAIDRNVWKRFVLEEQQHQVELKMGAAVGNGTAADIDGALQGYRENAALAKSLGVAEVSASIGAMDDWAAKGKKLQAAPTAERSYNAKQQKASALYKRRADNYQLINPYRAL